ncbi:MAG: hypothetical protein KDA90_21980 [Planctomycetaceae bacterium]|nr:hypothetical protein [Planctomycetaceae bacterium]
MSALPTQPTFAIDPGTITCPHCNGRRGFKRQCGGFLSDWVWDPCQECSGTGEMRASGSETITVTYEQLYALVGAANAYVAQERKIQRTRGIESWAVAKDVDHAAAVAETIGAMLKAVRA